MPEQHLRIMGTGCHFRLCELQADGVQGPTYTVQYELASSDDFDRYEIA